MGVPCRPARTDSDLPLHSPASPTLPRRPYHPLPLSSAPIQCPSAPVNQSRTRASCVSPTRQHTSFDTFSSTFHPKPAFVPAFHCPVHPTTFPPSALCAQGHSFPFLLFRALPPFTARTPTPHSIHHLPEARASSPCPLVVLRKMRSYDHIS